MKEYSFEKLDVWKLSKELSLKIYKITEKFPESEKFGLTSQLRRAAVSIPTNLSEGSGRSTGKDKAYFTQLAFSSLMECLNLLIIANELKFITENDLKNLRELIEVLSQKLSNYRRSQLNS